APAFQFLIVAGAPPALTMTVNGTGKWSRAFKFNSSACIWVTRRRFDSPRVGLIGSGAGRKDGVMRDSNISNDIAGGRRRRFLPAFGSEGSQVAGRFWKPMCRLLGEG